MVQVSRDLKSKPVSPERPELPASAVGYAERQPTPWLQPLEASFEGFGRIMKMFEHHPRADQVELRLVEAGHPRIVAQDESASSIRSPLCRRRVYLDSRDVPSLTLHLQHVVARGRANFQESAFGDGRNRGVQRIADRAKDRSHAARVLARR